MNFMRYVDALARTRYTELECQSCGSVVFSSNPVGSFCQFCEMFVSEQDPHRADGATKAVLAKARAAMMSGDWASAVAALEPLSSSTDPLVLYGLGSYYRAYSDRIYYSVDYSLGGFMHANADKRNDEYDRNHDNSMHLLSRSKELLFSSIYIISRVMKSDDWFYLYTEFIAEMSMSRRAQAHLVLDRLNMKQQNMVSNYANMVYLVETRSPKAEKFLALFLEIGEPNAFYYLARSLASSGDLASAERVLSGLGRYMPQMAFRFMRRISEAEEATRL